MAQSKSPDVVYGQLFVAVQKSGMFSDYKTFPDCTPKMVPSKILASYTKRKNDADFDLQKFVYEHFELPDTTHSDYKTDTTVSIKRHLDSLWRVLTCNNKATYNTSLLALPYDYVVPGGRFRELFYWDSYFMMLGLEISGRYNLIRDMVNNFAFLINSVGFIPNGNRSYFLSRSQPPFFALMIDLLAKKYPEAYLEYLPYLEKEYEFWMRGSAALKKNNTAGRRVVRLQDGEILNRYWDDRPFPRPEAYGKDIELTAEMSPAQSTTLYRHIRAACESGWDFSNRWNKDKGSMKTIHTADIIPVDLNCLMYFMEQTLSKAYKIRGDKDKSQIFLGLAAKRKAAILKYCWDTKTSFFMDYDFKSKKSTAFYSLAAVFPLYFHIATQDQARQVADQLEKDFLKDGGLLTSLTASQYQWDSPNGWAPLQWFAVIGLANYDHTRLATEAAHRWIRLNEKVFKSTGKMMEKYNVVDQNELTGGGEYELQDGFGWTNGVYLKLKSLYP